MARYIDGFVIPIKKSKVAAYKKMAKLGCKIWMEHGALDYYECIGQDLKGYGPKTTFTNMCKLKKDETVVFAFVVYKSKAHRTQVNKKVHADKRMQPPTSGKKFEMPFDMNRFATGGFTTIIQG